MFDLYEFVQKQRAWMDENPDLLETKQITWVDGKKILVKVPAAQLRPKTVKVDFSR